jgi:hypothetical protein
MVESTVNVVETNDELLRQCTLVLSGQVSLNREGLLDFIKQIVSGHEARVASQVNGLEQSTEKRQRTSGPSGDDGLKNYLEKHKKNDSMVLKSNYRVILYKAVVKQIWKKAKFIPSKAVGMKELKILDLIWKDFNLLEDTLVNSWKKSELTDHVVRAINAKMSHLRSAAQGEIKKQVQGM